MKYIGTSHKSKVMNYVLGTISGHAMAGNNNTGVFYIDPERVMQQLCNISYINNKTLRV
jgi:hypothetical protein